MDHGELVHHTKVAAREGGWDANRNMKKSMSRGWCKVCSETAKKAGSMTHKSAKMPDGTWVPKSLYVCKVCKVNLCRGCKDLWDHEHNRPMQEQCAPCDA